MQDNALNGACCSINANYCNYHSIIIINYLSKCKTFTFYMIGYKLIFNYYGGLHLMQPFCVLRTRGM